MKKTLLVALILLMTMPVHSLAWGKRGHNLVALIAFSMLDADCKQTIRQYLGNMSIEEASTWMDDIKGDHEYDYMKKWHYVNIDKGSRYERTSEPNVVTELNRVINELEHKQTLSGEQIKLDLLVLIHLVGDLHQPLHVGYGSDKGGNEVHVTYKNHSSNLHKVWDSEIIESENITLNDCLLQLRTYSKNQITDFSAINVDNWIAEPRAQLDNVYNFSDGTIDAVYISRSKNFIEDDILIAGIRLSSVLKKICH